MELWLNLQVSLQQHSVGSLDPNDRTLGLSGQSFSASIGSVSIADMQVGLTGQS